MKKGNLYIKVYDVNILAFQMGRYHSMKELVSTKCLNEIIMKNGIQHNAKFKYHKAGWNQA
jgi:hypothetical protein